MRKPFQLKTHIDYFFLWFPNRSSSSRFNITLVFFELLFGWEGGKRSRQIRNDVFRAWVCVPVVVKFSPLIRLMIIGRVKAPFVALGGNCSFSPVNLIFFFLLFSFKKKKSSRCVYILLHFFKCTLYQTHDGGFCVKVYVLVCISKFYPLFSWIYIYIYYFFLFCFVFAATVVFMDLNMAPAPLPL